MVEINYVSKRVEAMALFTNDAQVVVNVLKKNIFSRYGTPKLSFVMETNIFVIISLTYFWQNMEWNTWWLIPVISKLVAK